VTVDSSANNGMGAVQENQPSQMATDTHTLRFCQFGSPNCFDVVSYTMANGTASADFQFPQKGTFASTFVVRTSSGAAVSVSGPNISGSGVSYRSALLAANSVSGGLGETTGTVPLNSGLAVVQAQTVHIVLSGTTASHSFDVNYCLSPTTCTMQGNVTTDAEGNVTADLAAQGMVSNVGGIIVVSDSAGAEFVSAFRVQ
jgi:hypothetical protein